MLPTPRSHLINAGTVHPYCRTCERVADRPLDIIGLIARGLGDVPLVRLPMRCAACGSRDCGVLVSGMPAGQSAAVWAATGRFG